MGERPAILMGSSLGGYLAALYAARHPQQIERLVLMAPAFQFPRRWRERYSDPDWERWKREGSAPVFHYGEGREKRLGYRFVEDSAQYEDEPEFPQPALILHGVRDTVVPAGHFQDLRGPVTPTRNWFSSNPGTSSRTYWSRCGTKSPAFLMFHNP